MNELHRLSRSISAELSDLKAELAAVRPLLDKLRVSAPDAVELRAAATTLHAFYNCVERVMLLTAKQYQEPVSSSAGWHRELLVQMTRSTPERQRVLSDGTQLQLSGYLGFRHLFRHAYPMTLKWERMQPLVESLQETVESFSHDVDLFVTMITTGSEPQ